MMRFTKKEKKALYDKLDGMWIKLTGQLLLRSHLISPSEAKVFPFFVEIQNDKATGTFRKNYLLVKHAFCSRRFADNIEYTVMEEDQAELICWAGKNYNVNTNMPDTYDGKV